MLKAFALASGLIASSPADAPRFDLDCTITGMRTDDFELREEDIPVVLRVKLDLAAHRYCMAIPAQHGIPAEECKETKAVRAIEQTRLVLDRENGGRITISRESGAYLSDVTYRGYLAGSGHFSVRTRAYGTCELRPFSGFPRRKF